MASKTRRVLATHLALTYLLWTAAVAVVLSLASIWTVSTLEVHLQRIDMGMAVERVRTDYLAGQDVGREDRFFHGAPGSDAFPPWLRDLSEDFHKLEHDGRVWHVMAEDRDGVRYLLLRDYTDYEQGQQRSHWVTVAGLAASLVLAFILGTIMSRRVVRPLVQLAAQVVARPELPPQTQLAHDYPRNEIGQLAAAFDETYNQLEQAWQRERLFTADVSHELRTPLMVVSSSTDLLLDDPRLTLSQQDHIRRIRSAADAAHEQLSAYLMLARGRADVSDWPQTNTADAAREQAAAWHTRAAALGMRIELAISQHEADSDERRPALTYPTALLSIVLSNLIRNALQHASAGTRVRVATTPTTLDVSDDGPGIAAERHAEVFAPFVQGGKPGPENLGLGLSLVQRICQLQGWSVSLHSALGQGCVFHIDLGDAAR